MNPTLYRSLVVAGCVVATVAFAAGTSTVGAAQGRAAAAPAKTFTCNQVTAMTLTREWYNAGFEQAPGIAADRWQMKARQSGYITEWANPDSDFWNQPLESPCANGSTSPDHVVLTVLSWTPPCCSTAAEWEATVTKAVNTFKAKYPNLKRLDLMTVVRGPANGTCPLPPARGEYIAVPPEFDAGLAATAAKFPGLVFVGPKTEAPNCAAFQGGGPHLTPAGNAEVAKAIAAQFVNLQ